MTHRISLATAAALLASGCATQAPITTPPAPELVRYQCAEQVGMSVTYAGRATGTEGIAVLTWDGKDFPLKQEVAGSGARYTDGTLTLATKGDEAFVEKAGEIVLKDCNATP